MNRSLKDFDLAQLRHFYAVAHFQGFSRAARATGLSQPALSAGLKKLEAELKVELITRTSTTFKLTEPGTALFEFCQEMDLKWSDLLGDLTSTTERSIRRFRIGTSFAIGYSPITRLLRELKKSPHPLEADILTADSYQLISDLQEGRIDLAFLPDDVHGSELRFENLSKEQVILIGCPKGTTLKPELWRKQLGSELLVTYPRGSPMRSLVDRLLNREKLEFQSEVAANGVEAIKHLVLQGVGVAFVIRSLVQDELESGLLKELKVPITLPRRGITLAFRKNDRSQGAVLRDLFLDLSSDKSGPKPS